MPVVNVKPVALIRTPLPFGDESPSGYLLRLSSVNGFIGTRSIVSLLGFHPSYVLTMGWDYAAINTLLGEQRLPSGFGYRHGTSARGRVNILGQLVASEHVGLQRARVCPHCLRTLGYIPGAWDLKAYVACHIHKTWMVKFCSECGKRIRVSRGSLFMCDCGKDFCDEPTELAPDELIAMSEILAAKLGSECELAVAEKARFPIRNMLAMDLDVICKTMVQIAVVQLTQEIGARPNFKSADVSRCLPFVAKTFSNWPENFNLLCGNWRAFCEQREHCSSVFQICFEWMFTNIHKNLRERATQTLFMIEAALCYGLETWNKAPVNTRSSLYSGMKLPEPRFVSPLRAAKALGIRSTLIHDWLKKNKVSSSKRGTRYVVDMKDVEKIKVSKWRDLRMRDAAAYIGFSVDVFARLRKLGLIPSSFRTSHPDATSKEDLEMFKEGLVGLAEPIASAKGMLPLSKWLRGRLPAETKVRLLVKILNGDIRIYRQGSIRGRADIGALLTKRIPIEEELLSREKVQTKISVAECCDRHGINKIEAIGAVIAVCGSADKRAVRRASVEQIDEFFKGHIPIRMIAPKIKVGSRKFQGELVRRGLKDAVMSIVVRCRSDKDHMVHFVRRRMASKVAMIVAQR